MRSTLCLSKTYVGYWRSVFWIYEAKSLSLLEYHYPFFFFFFRSSNDSPFSRDIHAPASHHPASSNINSPTTTNQQHHQSSPIKTYFFSFRSQSSNELSLSPITSSSIHYYVVAAASRYHGGGHRGKQEARARALCGQRVSRFPLIILRRNDNLHKRFIYQKALLLTFPYSS